MCTWLAEAVLNNAAWCDAVASSHHISTHQDEFLWFSEKPMPPFYPNIITLKKGSSVVDRAESINQNLPSGWAIKDSFSELDLQHTGFNPVFDAHWYCRLPNQDVTLTNTLPHNVTSVSTPSELSRWVNAWGDGTGIFKFPLLESRFIELIYIERHGKIVAGMATNLSGHSVGISNIFGSSDEILSCIAALIRKYPKRGIVGYGSKSELRTLSQLDFHTVGDLRVWIHL